MKSGTYDLDVDASGNVYVLWSHMSTVAMDGVDVLFRYRTPDGTWSPIEIVSDVTEWNQERSDLDVTPSGEVYAVWRNKILSPHPPESLIRFRKRSEDGTWGAVELVANEDDEERSTDVIVDGSGNAYVIWYQYPFNGSYTESVVKMRKRNSDGTWDPIETIAQGIHAGDEGIVDSNGNLYILIRDPNLDQTYLYQRNPSGTWSGPESLGDSSTEPYMLGTGTDGKVYALLAADDGSRYLRYRMSDGNWKPAIPLGHNNRWLYLAIDPTGDGMSWWVEEDNGYQVYAAYRWEDGTWGSPIHAGNYPSASPQLAMTSTYDRYFLLWDNSAERRLYLSVADAPGDEPDLSNSGKSALPQDVSPGDRTDYTFTIRNTGKNSAVTLTDTLPLSTTLIPGSAWADEGTITATTRGITWTSVSSYSTAIEAGFAVTLSEAIDADTPVVIWNTAHLSDGSAVHPLSHALIVNPKRVYLPMVLRNP
jgi:uncharacterized repeat protein (TIGR01451 family)